jgi:methionyl-tRNA synthetase
MPRRPDAPSFFDLYPDDKRARTCPNCGKGKAPHAEMCKVCRRKLKPIRTHKQPTKIGERVLVEAYRAYRNENLSYGALADRFMDRVPHKSRESLAMSFSRAFKAKGWPVRQRTTTNRRAA